MDVTSSERSEVMKEDSSRVIGLDEQFKGLIHAQVVTTLGGGLKLEVAVTKN